MSLGFEEAITEIWSVDSQYSMGDGVIVQVTGSLQCKVELICADSRTQGQLICAVPRTQGHAHGWV